jgi:hypothetical protein
MHRVGHAVTTIRVSQQTGSYCTGSQQTGSQHGVAQHRRRQPASASQPLTAATTHATAPQTRTNVLAVFVPVIASTL